MRRSNNLRSNGRRVRLSSLAAVLLISACGGSGSDGPPPSINVSRSSIEVEARRSSASLNVSNGGGGTLSWTAAIPESVDWARITSGSSGTNSGTIEIRIEANTGAAREFVLTVSASGASSRTVTVRQAEAPAILVFSAPATRLDGEGGSIALQVHFNGGGSVPIANGLATRGAIMQPTQAQDPVT